MPAVIVEGRRIIRAPVQKVFQLVSRLDSSPRVTGLWFTADLVERKSNALTVHYRGYFAGIPVESVQRATLYPPNRIDFRQSRGSLKVFRGQYQLKPIEGDTEITLTLEAEVGMPLVSEAAARLVLHAFIERSLEKYKLTAERDLPRVVRRAADGAAAKEPAPTDAAEAAAAAEAEAAVTNGGPAVPPAEGPPAPPERRAPRLPRRGRSQPAPQGEAKPAQPGGEKKRRRRRRRRRGGRGGGTPGGGANGPGGRGAGESGSTPG
ncbi:MAG TPA: SRPBCC family protein [bacterium]|nr:SRPBCC family protein [bacterium]